MVNIDKVIEQRNFMIKASKNYARNGFLVACRCFMTNDPVISPRSP